MIIKTKRNWVNEVMIGLFSILIWLFCIVVICFFFSALINNNSTYINLIKTSFKMTNVEIRDFLYTVFVIFIACYLGLWLWKYYNTKRFGPSMRRKYPQPTTEGELLGLGLIGKDDYDTLQNAKDITLEKNPIRDIVE
ncbi:hypothetical protein DZB84_12520 [Bacillus sp. HNG]|nr:hypothetical protein DZB84_12520 [Bacillus sp. HNG]